MNTGKLSPMQKWILLRTAEKPDGSSHNENSLLTARVMREFYLMPLKDRNEIAYSGQNFSMQAIGKGMYASRASAISKAFARLEARGLVIRWSGIARWSGVSLTPEGESAARHLRLADAKECTSVAATRKEKVPNE